ncbi:DUF1360 domain-containing protein [Nocardiopsis sp. NRRL B-16309]|uniref:DUF1360 domain-containing protein n=1 Tax=Nocardiopsis sp. NRRL B-16309 TaxID=1519494 RepID=UPI0006B0645F|nr:DUF1360 domain-containing protein [Nocardiopsis sp. NRRL B-16309]KOX13994.1 hypothetical protein ADL05_17260 [Nocardiopsis sp. NRRL B-16309]
MTEPKQRIEEEARAYRGDSRQPLGGYAATVAVYTALVAAGVVTARVTGRRGVAPDVGPWDLVLMGLTTHKLSRTLAKDPVTSPLRAFFTRYRGVSAPSELKEEVRGEGGRRAVGELVTCPFCTAQWVATGYAFGLVFAPGLTRSAGAVFSAVALSDWLQFGYARLQQAQE